MESNRSGSFTTDTGLESHLKLKGLVVPYHDVGRRASDHELLPDAGVHACNFLEMERSDRIPSLMRCAPMRILICDQVDFEELIIPVCEE